MKFFNAITTTFFIASTLAAPSAQPFAVVTRDDGTSSWVGGSIGCFGTDGRIAKVDVTPGYQATFYSDYSCKGSVIGRATGQVGFPYPINTKSISLDRIVY
jgi:hypothetical protein